MTEILTTQFLEAIENSGAIPLFTSEKQVVNSTVYLGLNNRKIIVQTSSENIPELAGANYLIQLGLHDLIEGLFPGFFDRYRERKDLEDNNEDAE